MTRRNTLWRASELARAASDALILARAHEGNPRKQQASMEAADEALNAAIDLIWQSKESARERFFRVASEVSAAPFETQLEAA